MRHALHSECNKWWHQELYRMLKSGELVRPKSCSNITCTCTRNICGHSPDYSISPKINVQWLCSDCHLKWHGLQVVLHRERHPECRREYKKALEDRRLVRPHFCSKCGASDADNTIDGHHRDYSKPLEVEWLCRKCHDEVSPGKLVDQKAWSKEKRHEIGLKRFASRRQNGTLPNPSSFHGTRKGGLKTAAKFTHEERCERAQQGAKTLGFEGCSKRSQNAWKNRRKNGTDCGHSTSLRGQHWKLVDGKRFYYKEAV